MKKQRLFRADGTAPMGGEIDPNFQIPRNTGLPPVEPIIYDPSGVAIDDDPAMAAAAAYEVGRMIGTPSRRPGFRIGNYYWQLADLLAVVLTLCCVLATVKGLRR